MTSRSVILATFVRIKIQLIEKTSTSGRKCNYNSQIDIKAQTSAFLLRESPRRKQSKERDCKHELGENDHRSPSNRAQGHAYRQNACGVTSPTSRPQRHQKKKVFQNSAYMLKFVDKPNETIKYIWQSR